jgi:hypothetical protein
MKLSLLRLHLKRNILLRAPRCPDNPPKKPLIIPPRGKYFCSIDILYCLVLYNIYLYAGLTQLFKEFIVSVITQ